MSKYIFIKTANNDAYMNTAANFRGASHEADTAVTLYFDAVAGSSTSGAYDSIPLTVTTEKEQEVMDAIGGALAGSHSKGMVVIADDVASSYVNGNISAVGTITRGATGNRKTVEAITNGSAVTRTLTIGESGMLFTVNMSTVDNNVTLTLPAASTSAGVMYDFAFLVDCDDDADFILKTGAADEDFYGYQIRGAANSTLLDIPGTASTLTLDANVGQDIEGMLWHVMCDGANWHFSGYNTTAVGTANVTLATGV